MSTNAVAIIHSDWEDDTPICAIYKHWDGYPYLLESATSLSPNPPSTIGNGISITGTDGRFANGMGCFAAQLVSELKTQPGDVYLCPIDQREEYVYHLRTNTLAGNNGRVIVTCDQDPDWNPQP